MPRRSSRSLWTAKLTGQAAGKASPDPLPAARAAYEGVVLGIDPSLRGTGLAVIRFVPGKLPRLLASQTVKLRPKLAFAQCLGEIARQVEALTGTHQPHCVALEQTIYVQNFQTAQIMGAARGAAITPVAMRDIVVYEYAPLRIKQAVTGNGRASKVQVAAMMQHHLGLKQPLPSDEADAAAVALCHATNWRQ